MHRLGPRDLLPGVCRDLLQANLLRESDWNGSLRYSLQAGLARWMAQECGVHLRHLSLSLDITDNIEDSHCWGDRWRQVHGLPLSHETSPERPVPNDIHGFMITTLNPLGHGSGFRSFMVGQRVASLERFHTGCGAAVMGLIHQTLEETVGGATPQWAYNFIEETEWNDVIHDQRAELESDTSISERARREALADLLTTENFMSKLSPLAISSPSTVEEQIQPLQAGLQVLEARRRLSPTAQLQRNILHAALEVRERLEACPGACPSNWDHASDFANYEEFGRVMPCEVRWCRADWVPRVCDDYHNDIAQVGENHALWVQAWHSSRGAREPGSVAIAVERTRATVQVLGALDDLLGLLHFEEPEPKPRPSRRRGRTLAEVLNEFDDTQRVAHRGAPDLGPDPLDVLDEEEDEEEFIADV